MMVVRSSGMRTEEFVDPGKWILMKFTFIAYEATL